MTESKFGVIRKPATMKKKIEKKRRQDAVLRWIRSIPKIMVPEKRAGAEKESWKNDYECCKDEIRYITENEPEQTYPLE
ncbi:hypothetical protein A2U01_0056952 [Trifolium medium]|uniref:Uncharacterized protein n=1 Tax=Trifolium medium TaxID=97028 RepID=A0A392RGM3_9FABA|nr:hypothetical protein [Trifolium medium]